MARALGIGGVFFRSPDPAALSAWYREHLGFKLEENGCSAFKPDQLPGGGYTVWSPFKVDTTYFAPSRKSFMVNLIVDDLDGALAQVKDAGATLVGEPTDDPEFGRFGWFMDPEGNKVELWQPPAP